MSQTPSSSSSSPPSSSDGPRPATRTVKLTFTPSEADTTNTSKTAAGAGSGKPQTPSSSSSSSPSPSPAASVTPASLMPAQPPTPPETDTKSDAQSETKKKEKEEASQSTTTRTLPCPAAQRLQIARLRHQYTKRGLVEGDAYYALDAKWWNQWREAAEYGSEAEQAVAYDEVKRVEAAEASGSAVVPPPPITGDAASPTDTVSSLPPISNLSLLRSDGHELADVGSADDAPGPSGPSLRMPLTLGYEYHLIGEEVWNTLVDWYGGGPAVRRIVSKIEDTDDVKVQVYPEVASGQISAARAAGAGAGGPLDDDDDDGDGDSSGDDAERAAVLAARAKYAHPYVLPVAVQSEVQCGCCGQAAKTRCSKCRKVKYCSRRCQAAHWKVHKPVCGTPTGPSGGASRFGLTGLKNIGNTCFMASAIQCLSATWPLTNFFLSDKWKEDLNPDNVLGTGGKLATEYCGLMRELWFGSQSSVAPIGTKRAIAKFHSEFSGFAQQDAQELLTFLLDGLHEDLNRVKKKEYVEMEEAGDRPHAEAAKLAWDKHLIRNQSVVVDHMYGQLRSTVVCPTADCGRVSVTFDAFQVLTVPLPVQRLRHLKVFLYPALPVLPSKTELPLTQLVQHDVAVEKTATVKEVLHVLSEQSGIPPQNLWLCDVFEGRVFSALPNKRPVSRIRDDDTTVAFQLRDLVVAPEADDRTDAESPTSVDPVDFKEEGGLERMSILVYHFRPDPRPFSGGALTRFGVPMLVTCARRTSSAAFRQLVARQTARYTRRAKSETAGDVAAAFPLYTATAAGLKSPSASTAIPNSSGTSMADVLGVRPPAVGHVGVVWTGRFGARLDTDAMFTATGHASVEAAAAELKKARGSLYACLDRFTEPEELDKNNTWYCNRCKEHVQATKTMTLWSPPDVLVVGLKRFEYRNILWREKLNMFVEYPVQGLDLTDMVKGGGGGGGEDGSERVLYDLYGVVCHFGSMAFGHYTAFTNHAVARGYADPEGLAWHYYDDQSVTRVPASKVVTRAAYVLFYRRRKGVLKALPGGGGGGEDAADGGGAGAGAGAGAGPSSL